MIAPEKICDTVAENLRFVREKQNAIEPLMGGQIAELAYAMAQMTEEGADQEEKRHVWLETARVLGDPALHIELAKAYYDCLAEKNDREEEPKVPLAPKTICYLRNRGSDGAFDCITKNLTGTRAVYAAGHEEALENCYDEYSDACILPYSDPERGVHMGFRTMIARYGLKIAHMVRVENREGTAMDYALLRREIPTFAGEGYLAVTLPITEPKMLSESFQAAIRFGLANTDVTKLPEQFSATPSYDLHFLASARDAKRYLFYLALNHPRFDLLGFYQKERETI